MRDGEGGVHPNEARARKQRQLEIFVEWKKQRAQQMADELMGEFDAKFSGAPEDLRALLLAGTQEAQAEAAAAT